jgi:hypothetical protein
MNFYQEVEKYDKALEQLLIRIKGKVSTGLYEFSENILVPSVDWESDELYGFDNQFSQHCDEIASAAAPRICAEILNAKKPPESSHELYSIAYDLLANDSFRALSSYTGEEDYETLGGEAMDLAQNFSVKHLKTYINDALFPALQSQKSVVRTECPIIEKMLEKKLQKIK